MLLTSGNYATISPPYITISLSERFIISPQIRTHQQHPVIFVTHLENALAYGLGCANVDSTGRLIAHNKLCMAGKLPGNGHFLDITARKHAHQLRAVGTEYIKIFLSTSSYPW